MTSGTISIVNAQNETVHQFVIEKNKRFNSIHFCSLKKIHDVTKRFFFISTEHNFS